MNIQYLKKLQTNPSLEINNSGYFSSIKGISETEIKSLEQLYNNENPFPKVLKELLLLAGTNCFVCDYGINKTQQELQEWVREDMLENERTISRPFFAFDVYGGSQFLFIYLDEGDNPEIYEAHPYSNDDNWIRHLNNLTIKNLVDNGIERIKRGENPF